MTARDLHTRLGRMIEENLIRENDEVFLTSFSIPDGAIAITGMIAPGHDFQHHKIASSAGVMEFGRVVP